MTSTHQSALEAAMERIHDRKLQFDQAHPNDWRRPPAGCQKYVDSGACWWKGRAAAG